MPVKHPEAAFFAQSAFFRWPIAGVAQLAPDESGEDAIKRADQAMYLAKRAGKNRVLGA